ncbi:hypothetical protein [Dyella sp. 20L07]|uniref:hypothetical protein n=1 Tax=Dyella sp. 20L07 TaxID=3384240 RepID=UPI003D275D9B
MNITEFQIPQGIIATTRWSHEDGRSEFASRGPFVHKIMATIWYEHEPPYFGIAESMLRVFDQRFIRLPTGRLPPLQGVILAKRHYCWRREKFLYAHHDIEIWTHDHPLYHFDGLDPRHVQGRAEYRTLATKAATDFILEHDPGDMELVDLVGTTHVPRAVLSYQIAGDGADQLPDPWEYHADFVGTTISPTEITYPKRVRAKRS